MTDYMIHHRLTDGTRSLAVVCLLAALYGDANSQRMPQRFVTMSPLFTGVADAPRGQTTWAPSSAGWGEFGAYRIARDPDHAWLQRLGGMVEFVRWGDVSSIFFVGNIEFIADHRNNIGFNPRAIFWEEGFVYAWLDDRLLWEVGYYHRCKHDVENLHTGEQRSLIYGSVQIRRMAPLYEQSEDRLGYWSVTGDIYTLRQDDRRPGTSLGDRLSMNRLLSSVSASVRAQERLRETPFWFYISAFIGVSAYGTEDSFVGRFRSLAAATVNGGLSSGISVKGGTEIRFGLSYEYLSDSGVPSNPREAHLVSLSISILDPSVMF